LPVKSVVVVGASLAGSAAARLFAQAGARVSLLERRPDPAAYKVVCTHNILSSAVPTIERLGLAERLAARGATRTRAWFWTPYGGWIEPAADVPQGYGITRSALDPLVRDLAAETPGVELMLGETATALVEDRGRVAGVQVEGPDGRRTLEADLVIGADGRHSTVARLAGLRGRTRPNNRCFYFAYWRGLRAEMDRARLWFLEPDIAAWFPNEDDVSVVAAGFHRDRIPDVRADPEGAYRAHIAGLADGPELGGAERASKLIGWLPQPNTIRPPARPGVALVGDAAIATDPLFGVGCGWALQTAEWLVDEVAAAPDLDEGLARYRRAFRRRLAPHQLQINDFSSGRPLRANERLAFRAAAADPAMARVIEEVASRRHSPLRWLDPRVVLGLWRHM
jgi:flavin-dependent dehydrogenase